MFWIKRFFKSFTVYTVCFALISQGVLAGGKVSRHESFDNPAYRHLDSNISIPLKSSSVSLGLESGSIDLEGNFAETDTDDRGSTHASISSRHSWKITRADYTSSLRDKPGHEMTLEELNAEVQRIHAAEDTWRHFVRWVYLSRLGHRTLYATFLKYPKTETPHISLSPLQEPLLQDPPELLHMALKSKPLWVHGRAFPLTEHDQRNVYALNSTMEGFEAVAVEGVHLIFLGLMVSQLIYSIKDGQNFFDVFKLLFESDDNSIRDLYNIGNPVPHAQGLWAFASLPFLWAGWKGIQTYREGTEERFEEALETLKQAKTGIYPDFFRWFWGCYKIRHAFHVLDRSLIFDDRTTPEERDKILDEVHDFAQKHKGQSRMNAFQTFYEMVDGVSTRNFVLLDEQTQQDLLKNKALALHYLMHAAHKPFQKAFRYYGAHFMMEGMPAFYARYLLWTLGQCEGALESVGWLGVRAIKSAITILLFKAIIEGILDILDCPQKQGTTWTGPTDWASDYSEQCFHAYVQQFNQVPGQPVKTLMNPAFLKQFHLPDEITLNFSNKGLNGTVLAQLMRGFREGRPDVRVVGLDVSQNAIQTLSYQDVIDFVEESRNFNLLISLDLSNNYIGRGSSGGSMGTSLLSSSFQFLSSLQYLDLSSNNIGQADSNGMVSLGNALKYLTNLQYLDLSNNYIENTDSNGTLALGKSLPYLSSMQHFDLSDNYIGYWGSAGSFSLGNGLAYLINLQSLNLENNNIGQVDSKGTVSLGNALKYLTNIQYLDLSYNFIEKTDCNGTIALGDGLRYLRNLQNLNLAVNHIGATDSNGTVSLGNGLQYLTSLIDLNLWNNFIGKWDENGINALGVSIKKMRRLTTLNLMLNEFDVSQFFITYEINLPKILGFWNPFSLEIYLGQLPNTTIALYLNDTFKSTNEFMLVFQKYFPRFPNLRVLNLQNNGIGHANSEDLITLAESLQSLPSLQTLDLSYNWIGLTDSNGTAVIGNALKNLKSLQTLNLSNNNIENTDSMGTSDLAMGIRSLVNLQFLSFYVNSIGQSDSNGTEALGNSLKDLTRLQFLDLSGNQIGNTDSRGTVSVGNALRYLTNLQVLRLADNEIERTDSRGTISIGQSLQYLTSLQQLHFETNWVGYQDSEGVIEIAKSLYYLKELTDINLSSENIGTTGEEGPQAIINAISHLLNYNLQTYNLGSIVNITWSKAQRELNILTDRALKEQCESQLCHKTGVSSVSVHDVTGAANRRRSIGRDQYSETESEAGRIVHIKPAEESSVYRQPPILIETLTSGATRPEVFGPLMLVYKILQGVTDGARDTFYSHPKLSISNLNLFQQPRPMLPYSKTLEKNPHDIPPPKTTELGFVVAPKNVPPASISEIFNHTTTPANMVLGAVMSLHFGKQVYDTVRSWIYPTKAPDYKDADYADPIAVRKALKMAKQKLGKISANLPKILQQNKNMWILEDAFQDVESFYQSLLKKSKILKTALDDFGEDLKVLTEGLEI